MKGQSTQMCLKNFTKRKEKRLELISSHRCSRMKVIHDLKAQINS